MVPIKILLNNKDSFKKDYLFLSATRSSNIRVLSETLFDFTISSPVILVS
jgi:hypothetical protein